MFIDASVIVAVFLREDGWETAANRIEGTKSPCYTSPIVRFETVAAIARAKTVSSTWITPRHYQVATSAYDTFCAETSAKEILVSSDIGRIAVEAFVHFGKGSGHKANLNMSDCYAYACAKAYRLPLFAMGDKFDQTDVKTI